MTEKDVELVAPKTIVKVSKEKAAGLVPVNDETRGKLAVRVDAFIDELMALEVNSPEFGKKIDSIAAMGQKEIGNAANQSNRFLDRPVKSMEKDGGIGTSLIELRKTVESLDPEKQGKIFTGRNFAKYIPFIGNKVTKYFDSYKSAQGHISGILGSMAEGKDNLLKDNAEIDGERVNLWNAMGSLEQMVIMSKMMDTKLEELAADLDSSDPNKARIVRESALFYVRQRTQDFLTQLAVSVQGYLALDQVKKNNVELIKGVDRASTTTVSALRTAITVAQAMTNQRLVLGQITALNTTTANLIDSTSKLLLQNTTKINQQASTAAIPLETLQRAFQNIYATMDSIDTFKVKALGEMKKTVDTLTGEVEKSRGYIARAQGAEGNDQKFLSQLQSEEVG
jgi:uncharacterized protein YaaN involved in tellurite resistance